MITIKSDGSKWLLDKDGNEIPYRWYHALKDRVLDYWYSRDWRHRQQEFQRTGTRYYGDGGTISPNTHLDVETDKDGNVVAVWFRCQHLPFKQTKVDDNRADDMHRLYEGFNSTMHGVEIKDVEGV